jgi:formylglycine-generating enzyme required for sulfatase activity
MRHWALVPLVLMAGASTAASVGASADTGIDWVPVGTFEIARTETTVAQFRRFVAASGMNTAAERAGGGSVYEHGWVRKPGWTWRAPFGSVPADDEPAVHVTWHEAQAFCLWAGGALPDDRQWTAAAYDEQRARPIAPFVTGRSYPFPSGESAVGAQCLDDCGPAARERAVRHGARLSRGDGHARAGSTPAGVNSSRPISMRRISLVPAPIS